MTRCPCCRKNESLEQTCDYYQPGPLTTHLQGKLYGPTGEVLPNAVITVEITDKDGSSVGLRTSTITNEHGIYNFKVTGGYSNIYVAKNVDSSEYLLGRVHVAPTDYDKVYTIEGLIHK